MPPGSISFDHFTKTCTACHLCVSVCPVDECITMERLTSGNDPRTGAAITDEKLNWTAHINNPMRKTD